MDWSWKPGALGKLLKVSPSTYNDLRYLLRYNEEEFGAEDAPRFSFEELGIPLPPKGTPVRVVVDRNLEEDFVMGDDLGDKSWPLP